MQNFQARQGLSPDVRNDNFTNVYELTGNENMGVMKTELHPYQAQPLKSFKIEESIALLIGPEGGLVKKKCFKRKRCIFSPYR